MTTKTHHACALQINQTGILIKGQSGSGKTSLMMGLLERAKQENTNGFLVADDQVSLIRENDNLIAITPKQIAGMVEIRGFGIVNYEYKKNCEINLVAEIIEDEAMERMPHQKFWEHQSIKVPLVQVPNRHEKHSVRIIYAWLLENACLQV